MELRQRRVESMPYIPMSELMHNFLTPRLQLAVHYTCLTACAVKQPA